MNENDKITKEQESVSDEQTGSKKPEQGKKKFYYKKKKKAQNDVGWYSRYPDIYNAASNFIWSRPSGLRIPRTCKSIASGKLTNREMNQAYPGILALEVVHGCGSTHDTGTNAPINVAAKAIYTWVRHMNSGHSNYDAPDLMLYLQAMDEVYALISYIGRCFGTPAMFAGSNRFLPVSLGDIQHLDTSNLTKEYATFRAWANILIQKAASLVVPLELDIFKRHTWLYANYYIEGSSIKDQMYFTTPKGFRIFDRDASGAGYLRWVDLAQYYDPTSQKLNGGSLLQLFDDMLSPLIADEDINVMAGDILKAFGADGVQKLAFLPEMFISTPQFVDEVLWQYKNAKVILGDISNLDITQDGNHEYLLYEPTVSASAGSVSVNTLDPLLVTDKEPTREINMINSRLVALADYGVDGSVPNAGAIVCASDFVAGMRLAFIDYDGIIHVKDLPRALAFQDASLGDFGVVSSFKFMPELNIYNSANGDVFHFSHFDLDDFTVLSKDNVRLIHDAAMLSLYSTPRVAMLDKSTT